LLLVLKRKRTKTKSDSVNDIKSDIQKDKKMVTKNLSKVESIKKDTHFKPITTHKTNNIFISYRRNDSADVTGRIYDRLVLKFGNDSIFKDVDSIPLGVDFREHLDEMVSQCEVFITIIGDQWLYYVNSEGHRSLDDPKDFVRIEIESALKRRIPVIPILVRGATIPKEEELPTSLRGLAYRNGIPIRPDPDFHKDMDRLISGLDKILNKP